MCHSALSELSQGPISIQKYPTNISLYEMMHKEHSTITFTCEIAEQLTKHLIDTAWFFQI